MQLLTAIIDPITDNLQGRDSKFHLLTYRPDGLAVDRQILTKWHGTKNRGSIPADFEIRQNVGY